MYKINFVLHSPVIDSLGQHCFSKVCKISINAQMTRVYVSYKIINISNADFNFWCVHGLLNDLRKSK